MHLGIRLFCYFGVLGALIGGATGALFLIAPERGAANTAPATVQQRPVPPKIAAWQERNAIPLPAMENPKPESPRLAPAVAAFEPVSAQNLASKEATITNRFVQLKQKPRQTAAKRSRRPNTESALGYAAAAPSAYEPVIFAFRDRPSP